MADIADYEDAHNRSLISKPIQATWLTNYTLLKTNFVSSNQNGTMVFITLAESGHQRQEDYKTIDQMFLDRIDSECTSTEQGQFMYGIMGQLSLELDSQDRLLLFIS